MASTTTDSSAGNTLQQQQASTNNSTGQAQTAPTGVVQPPPSAAAGQAQQQQQPQTQASNVPVIYNSKTFKFAEHYQLDKKKPEEKGNYFPLKKTPADHRFYVEVEDAKIMFAYTDHPVHGMPRKFTVWFDEKNVSPADSTVYSGTDNASGFYMGADRYFSDLIVANSKMLFPLLPNKTENDKAVIRSKYSGLVKAPKPMMVKGTKDVQQVDDKGELRWWGRNIEVNLSKDKRGNLNMLVEDPNGEAATPYAISGDKEPANLLVDFDGIYVDKASGIATIRHSCYKTTLKESNSSADIMQLAAATGTKGMENFKPLQRKRKADGTNAQSSSSSSSASAQDASSSDAAASAPSGGGGDDSRPTGYDASPYEISTQAKRFKPSN